jgi:RNA polymerase sigma-70 factor (ECF subfamily)
MSNRTLIVGWRQRWNRSLMQFIGRRVRTTVDVEDLAQETYLRLLRAPDLQEVNNPQGYLLKVASHVVAEWRDRQLPDENVDALHEDALVDERTPEFDLEVDLSRVRLERALGCVPVLTRTVLLLKFREHQPCKEIARRLDLTERQVRRHLSGGFERLRDALRD